MERVTTVLCGYETEPNREKMKEPKRCLFPSALFLAAFYHHFHYYHFHYYYYYHRYHHHHYTLAYRISIWPIFSRRFTARKRTR